MAGSTGRIAAFDSVLEVSFGPIATEANPPTRGADCGLSPQERNRKGSSKKADAQGIDQFFLSCKRSEGRQ